MDDLNIPLQRSQSDYILTNIDQNNSYVQHHHHHPQHQQQQQVHQPIYLNNSLNYGIYSSPGSCNLQRKRIILPEPVLIQPKVCRSPIIHSVQSKRVTKPQAQQAYAPIDPPLYSSFNNNNNNNTTIDTQDTSYASVYTSAIINEECLFNRSIDSHPLTNTNKIHNVFLTPNIPPPIPPPPPLTSSSTQQTIQMDYYSLLQKPTLPPRITQTHLASPPTNIYSPVPPPPPLPPPPYPGNQNKLNSTNDENQLIQESSINTITTCIRKCLPQAFKFYMEQHIENVFKSYKDREYRRMQLENEMIKFKMNDENLKEQMRKLLNQKETNYLRLKRAKMNKKMFEQIKLLGIGAFGEVNLVRKKDTGCLYAMKTLHKSDVFNRNQAAHVKAERDILAEADNEWVVKLYYSFQDDENLYFVMDYIPGGDLMNLLIKLQIFDENLAKFYISELVCAIESVHNLGFIHRDIKPDNILIDKNGHIKLTDFGLCTGFHWTHSSKHYQIDDAYNRILERKMNSTANSNNNANNRRIMAHSLVGTPNYIAPEILSRKGYTKSCDWWSMGAIFYEMIIGVPPFRDETPLLTQDKVINWRNTLKIPSNTNISDDARDLILKLLTDSDTRLGLNGANEIKTHKFFSDIDFSENLHKRDAPYIPPIKYPTDTSNFEPIDAHQQQQQQKQKISVKNDGNNACQMLYEFTFRRFFDEANSEHFYVYTDDDQVTNDNEIGSINNDNKENQNEFEMKDLQRLLNNKSNNQMSIDQLTFNNLHEEQQQQEKDENNQDSNENPAIYV